MALRLALARGTHHVSEALLCDGNISDSDINLWWILWISRYRTRRSPFALLALGWGGYFVFVWRVVTWLDF